MTRRIRIDQQKRGGNEKEEEADQPKDAKMKITPCV